MAEIHDRVLSAARNLGVRYVRFTWTDNAGSIRAKAVHTAFLANFLGDSRVGITVAAQAFPVMYDVVVGESGLTPAGEVHLQPDWSTFVPLPHVPGQARVLADIYRGDEPWGHCPRSFLKRMIARASARDLRVMTAFENEFYLLRPEGDSWRPADSTVFCQTDALDRAGPVLEAITSALEAQGVLVEMVYPESGPGQFELPIRYADGLAAALPSFTGMLVHHEPALGYSFLVPDGWHRSRGVTWASRSTPRICPICALDSCADSGKYGARASRWSTPRRLPSRSSTTGSRCSTNRCARSTLAIGP